MPPAPAAARLSPPTATAAAAHAPCAPRADEPGPEQSDPTLLDLHLCAASRRAGGAGAGEPEPAHVRSVEASRVPREVGRWLASVAELRRTAPVGARAAAPPADLVERLLRVWPPGVQAALAAAPLPGADLDASFADYARLACALLDVPVRASLVHALHAMFALYVDAREHPALAAYIMPEFG